MAERDGLACWGAVASRCRNAPNQDQRDNDSDQRRPDLEQLLAQDLVVSHLEASAVAPEQPLGLGKGLRGPGR